MASKPHPDDVEKITRLFAGWSGFQNVPLEEIETKCKRRVEVEKLFTPEQYGKLSDFEKKRLKNINRTMSIKYYLELPLPSERDLRAKVGLPPIFTNSDTSSEESDEEWTPRKPTPKKNPGFTSVADIMKRTRFITKNCTVKNEKYEEKPDSDELKVVKDSIIPMRTKGGKLVTSSGGTISEKKVSKEVKKVEPPKLVVKEKYPLRDIPKKCYEEYKVPTEDDFLFCDDCEKLHLGDCPVHGPFQMVCDTPVKMGIEDRAKKTCPAGISIGVSKIRGGGLGAWCDTEFPKNCVFGPYEGVQVERNDVQKLQKLFQGGYSWEIYKKGQLSHYIDGNDKNQSNWLRYINCAREEPEQNVIAYQYQGNIYYRTYKPVKKGMELLVWYGNQYAKSLGIPLEYRIKEVAAATKAQICFDDYSRCSKCEKVFADDETLARHMKIKHPDRSVVKRHKCPWCQYSSDYLGSVKLHKLTHTKEKPYKCDICDKAFTQKIHLKSHKLTHTGVKPYKCEICGKDFTKVSNLRKHKNTVHEKSKYFVCEVCSKAFGQTGHLKDHMRTHTGEQPYKCKHCDKRFNQSNNLRKHERTHTGEKPYKCKHCDKRFNQSNNLRKHERTHTGEKPYKCKHCDKRFTNSCNLRTHERTHTGEKPYKCEHCSQAFTQLSNLRYHVITIHTKRFPHVCHVCDKGFIDPKKLKSHIEKHHPTSE